MYIKIPDFIKYFIEVGSCKRTRHVYIRDSYLIHYNTKIAYRINYHIFILNREHYSKTTTRYLNIIDRYPGVTTISYDSELEFLQACSKFDECRIIE